MHLLIVKDFFDNGDVFFFLIIKIYFGWVRSRVPRHETIGFQNQSPARIHRKRKLTGTHPVTVPKYIATKAIWTTPPTIIATTGTWCLSSTKATVFENGNPLSRAKANKLRLPSANKAFAHPKSMTTMRLARTHAAALELVESKKIWISGTRVGVSATVLMFPIQKQTDRRNIKPVMAPIQTLQTIALGACLLASFISSVMCAGASKSG